MNLSTVQADPNEASPNDQVRHTLAELTSAEIEILADGLRALANDGPLVDALLEKLDVAQAQRCTPEAGYR